MKKVSNQKSKLREHFEDIWGFFYFKTKVLKMYVFFILLYFIFN